MMHEYILKNHFKGWKETKQKKKTHSTEKGAGRKSTTLFSLLLDAGHRDHAAGNQLLFLESLWFETSFMYYSLGKVKGKKSQPIVMSISTQPQGTGVDIYEGTCLKGTRRTRIFLPGWEGRMWTVYLQKRHRVLLVPWARIMSVTKQKSENKNCRKTTCEASAAGVHSKTDKTHMEKHAHLPVFTNQWFFGEGKPLLHWLTVAPNNYTAYQRGGKGTSTQKFRYSANWINL